MAILLSLPALKAEVMRIAAVVGATENDLPTFAVFDTVYYYRPCLDVTEAGYQFIIVERGQEISRVTTSDIDECFYHVFNHVIAVIATHHASVHHDQNDNFSPRMQFQKKVELAARLSDFKWADRIGVELNRRAADLEKLYKVEAEVLRLAVLIGAADHYYLPTFGGYKRGGDDEYCIELAEDGYEYFYIERGVRRLELTTGDLNDLLYRIFQTITSSLAGDYMSRHRHVNQDYRRVKFQKQVELLAVISPQWSARQAEEHDAILRNQP
jgi:hypothetical protein